MASVLLRSAGGTGYFFKEVFEVSYLKTFSRSLTIGTLTVGMWFFVGHAAYAGNVVLTGHDDDFHQSTAAQAQALGMITLARAGSTDPTLPVLSFDQGAQLTGLLTTLGIPFTNVNPNSGVPEASLFNPTLYSAMVIASDQSCGGCDNDASSSANLAAASGDIALFFNGGGGIVAFAGAANTSYYSFLPASATNPGIVSDSFAFTQTAAGLANGVPAVNGDFPHNYFNFPGVGGMSTSWIPYETYTGPSSNGDLINQPFTVGITSGTIGDGGITGGGGTVPEPPSLFLLGAGLVAFAVWRRKVRV